MASSSVQICKNFQNGNCKFGKNCHYSHARQQSSVAHGSSSSSIDIDFSSYEKSSLCLSHTALGITKTYTELELKSVSEPGVVKRDAYLGMCRLNTLLSIARAKRNPFLVTKLQKYHGIVERAFANAADKNVAEVSKDHFLAACHPEKIPDMIWAVAFNSDNCYRKLGRDNSTMVEFEMLKSFGFETESYYAKRIADEKEKAELAILKQQAKSMAIPRYTQTTFAQHAACANSTALNWADYDDDEEIFYVREINDFVTGRELKTNIPLKLYIDANRVCCF
jgi:hypothetical protein